MRPLGGAHSQVPSQYHQANPNGLISTSLNEEAEANGEKISLGKVTL